MKLKIFAPALFVLFFVSACASSGPVGPLRGSGGPTSTVEVFSGSALPMPNVVDYSATSRPYVIGPFDLLEIGVFEIEGFETREYRVDSSGRLSFPLIGAVDTVGLSPGQLEDRISAQLGASFIRNPRVSVNLKEAVSRNITVTGEVERPGLYPVANKITLVSAVAVAGGMTDFARTEEVLIFRTVNGQRMAGIYNLSAIERGNYDDPELYPNDVVIVGNSPQKRLIRDLVTAAPALIAPILVTLISK